MAKSICLDTICLAFSYNLMIQKCLLFTLNPQAHPHNLNVCLLVFGSNVLGKCFGKLVKLFHFYIFI